MMMMMIIIIIITHWLLNILMSVIRLFQTPFQRLVKRMTRFHTKKTPDKTLKKLKEVLDSLKYNFAVNSQSQVDTF